MICLAVRILNSTSNQHYVTTLHTAILVSYGDNKVRQIVRLGSEFCVVGTTMRSDRTHTAIQVLSGIKIAGRF